MNDAVVSVLYRSKSIMEEASGHSERSQRPSAKHANRFALWFKTHL